MPYTQGIVGSCGNWGHISNFSLGWVTTWGIHHVDIAQWGNNADMTGLIEVEGTGVFPENGLYDCAVAWDMKLKYVNGVTLCDAPGTFSLCQVSNSQATIQPCETSGV